MSLILTVVARGETEKNAKLKPGMIVKYLGHVPGGNVAIIRVDGERDIAHPFCFEELR